MFRLPYVWLTLCLVATSADRIGAQESATIDTESVRAAVAKGLPLLVKGAKGHIAQKSCFACHNQATPMLAFVTARERGFEVHVDDIKEQLEFIAKFLDGNCDNYREGRGQGGQIDTASYALFTLELGGRPLDSTTEAVVEYLLQYNKNLDHWRSLTKRPPSEASHFTVNYLTIRALKKWGTPPQKDRIDKRISEARSWLRLTPAADTEDRVFRLLALDAAGVANRELQSAARDLARTQRPDGGWGQLDAMESDAYATGTALTALNLVGGMSADNPAYQRGLAYLVNSQLVDGSWKVKSRSRPFQTYYESGFPHEKDQFISMAASGWAVTALALACPPAKSKK